MDYTNDPSRLDELSLRGFFEGWPNGPSEKTHRKLLQQSQYIWLAFEEQQVIGFINAISDQTLSAYIPLLEVLPAYRGKGIGRKLVQLMLESLQDFYMVDLACDDALVPFYEGIGAIKGNGMMFRNYEHQAGK